MNLNIKEFTTDNALNLTSITTLDNKTYKTKTEEDARIETNKDVTITTNTSTEVTPDTGYDAMAKVTVTTSISNSVPVYYAGMGGSGSEDETDITESEALILFSDANMTTPLDPTTLTSSDEVYALYLSGSSAYGFGIDSSLVGLAVHVNELKLGVDIVDTKFIRFDGDIQGSTSYFVIDQTSTPTNMTWLKALTTFRYY